VRPEQFNLITGKEQLSLYQFGTKEAKHYFCTVCGIHPFSNPRAAPDMVSINVRCLDNFDLESKEYAVVKFDGRHWQEAVAELNAQLNIEAGANKDASR